MTTRKLTFMNDPGHGWLSVSLVDIRALGIVDDISGYSYMNETRAFLEEDCDASVFLVAAENAGWTVEIRDSYREAFNRNLASYNPYFVRHPRADGVRVSHRGRNGTFRGDRLEMDDGGVFSIRKSNPYLGLTVPVTEYADYG